MAQSQFHKLVRTEALMRQGLSRKAEDVAVYVGHWARQGKTAFSHQDTIAEQLHTSPRSVQRAVKELHDQGLIDVRVRRHSASNNDKRTNVYSATEELVYLLGLDEGSCRQTGVRGTANLAVGAGANLAAHEGLPTNVGSPEGKREPREERERRPASRPSDSTPVPADSLSRALSDTHALLPAPLGSAQLPPPGGAADGSQHPPAPPGPPLPSMAELMAYCREHTRECREMFQPRRPELRDRPLDAGYFQTDPGKAALQWAQDDLRRVRDAEVRQQAEREEQERQRAAWEADRPAREAREQAAKERQVQLREQHAQILADIRQQFPKHVELDFGPRAGMRDDAPDVLVQRLRSQPFERVRAHYQQMTGELLQILDLSRFNPERRRRMPEPPVWPLFEIAGIERRKKLDAAAE